MFRLIRYSSILLPLTMLLCATLAFPSSTFGFFGSLTVEKEKQLMVKPFIPKDKSE